MSAARRRPKGREFCRGLITPVALGGDCVSAAIHARRTRLFGAWASPRSRGCPGGASAATPKSQARGSFNDGSGIAQTPSSRWWRRSLWLPILGDRSRGPSARQSFIRLPPDAWSLRWWGARFFNDVVVAGSRSSRVSRVAAFTTLISALAGTAAALGIARSSPRALAGC